MRPRLVRPQMVRRREKSPSPPPKRRRIYRPHFQASLRSSFRLAKNPGSQLPWTANPHRLNFWSPAANAPSEAERRSRSRQETPAGSTFDSMGRSLKPGESTGRSRPLPSARAGCHQPALHRHRRPELFSFISSIYLSSAPFNAGWLPLNARSLITGQFRCIEEAISGTVLEED